MAGTSEVRNYIQILDCMFKDKREYNTVTRKEKDRNFFMINRRMSIKYPVQAFKLAFNNINKEYAIDCWYMITKRFNGVKPGWMYTKTEKEKIQKIKYSDLAKNFYMKTNEIDEKTFQKALEFEPKKMQDILIKLDKQLKLIKYDDSR